MMIEKTEIKEVDMCRTRDYNKLVRDKIPQLIKADGNDYKIRIADELEYQKVLLQKLKEETDEFIDNPCIEEIADILEVVDAIKKHFDFSETEILQAKSEKFRERGGFEKRIILDQVIFSGHGTDE